MELTTEQRATLEKWLDSLIGKSIGGLLIVGWTTLGVWLTTEKLAQGAIIGSGVLLLLLARLGLAYLRVRKDRDTLAAELAMPRAEPWEPDDEARTVLCFLVDGCPNRYTGREIQEHLSEVLSGAKIEWALERLVRNDYLKFDDGLGSYPGCAPEPETYFPTTKGKIYVENWRRERGL